MTQNKNISFIICSYDLSYKYMWAYHIDFIGLDKNISLFLILVIEQNILARKTFKKKKRKWSVPDRPVPVRDRVRPVLKRPLRSFKPRMKAKESKGKQRK